MAIFNSFLYVYRRVHHKKWYQPGSLIPTYPKTFLGMGTVKYADSTTVANYIQIRFSK